MNIVEDTVMFIPACGWGERVAERGVKPFIQLKDKNPEMALDRVMSMAPKDMQIEIAIRREMGCPVLKREATVHFMKPTAGQGITIYRWLRMSRMRQYVMISNCDNFIDPISILLGLDSIDGDSTKGIVFTFKPEKQFDTRWSYVEEKFGRIQRIVEKKAISNQAVAGVYILNSFALRMALSPSDLYLSDALNRMTGLRPVASRGYVGWNDLEQLREMENQKENV